MKTTIELQYNDLKLFLTEADKAQIKAFPMPSLEQAKMLKKQWEMHFGTTVIPTDQSFSIINGMIWVKPFMKVFDEYPELFI